MLNIIAMEILINDLLSNKSVFIIEKIIMLIIFCIHICLCVLNFIPIIIKLKETYSYLEWRRWGERRNLRGDI